MSLYSLFSGALQRIKRNHWGARIPDKDGNLRDTGVQLLADELFEALSSTSPIEINDRPIEIYSHRDGPAIVIYSEHPNQAPIRIVGIDSVSEVAIKETSTVAQSGGEEDQEPSPTTGFSGTVVADEISSVSVSGCTVTINYTRRTLSFSDGLLKSVS